MSDDPSDPQPSFIAMRYWPSLILIGLAGPLWLALRGWYHTRMLIFTLIGLLSIAPLAFSLSLIAQLLNIDLEPFWASLAWPVTLYHAWPYIGALAALWLALSLAWHTATASRGGPSETGSGRFALLPSTEPDSLTTLLAQWALIALGAAALWLYPRALVELGWPIAPELMRSGYAVSAVAYALLSAMCFFNGGSYPGFPIGQRQPSSTRPLFRAFRFVARLRSNARRRAGLSRVFSRRPAALQRIASGDSA